MRSITLVKQTGDKIRLNLNHRGSGVDRLNRRWILEMDSWQCVDTGESAQRLPLFHRLFGTTRPQSPAEGRA
jgi:hypothetical protein